ncbi:MAG: hypothetical protein A2298_03425 [Gammaproteobacteria bacterium RIFOXYB2_FULL_38_6]|nr:MAG: hypothetical protein A2298_03425 [Gammaproteobacteria bacterium RIFOXYB2_FULL_38_6]
MWTFDEIEEMNPKSDGQKKSALMHLKEIGAYWPDLLCETATQLEELGPPFIYCFTQLPYPINVEKGNYTLPGKTEGVRVDLSFRLFKFNFNDSGKIFVGDLKEENENPAERVVVGTQVIGLIKLWSGKNKYYNNYLECVTYSGLKEQIINKPNSNWSVTGGWHQRPLKSAKAFENEISKRLLTELYSALQFFIPTYSIVSHDETKLGQWLYNYFCMTAPGRISLGDIPKPIFKSFCKHYTIANNRFVSHSKLCEALKFGMREISKFERQLLAMDRLVRDGEPELALIGTISAIEWFMGAFVARENKWQPSLRDCLKIEPYKSNLEEDLKNDLREAALLRNSIVHGAPPSRENIIKEGSGFIGKLPISNVSLLSYKVQSVIESGLVLYRRINELKRQKKICTKAI